MFSRSSLILVVTFLFVTITACQALMSDAAYQAHVWEDLNQNEQEDPVEQPLADVQIQIVDTSGRLWRGAKTDPQGNVYEFSAGGKCGQYDIYLSVPNGYKPTTPVVVKTPNCEVAKFGLTPIP